MTQTLDEIRRHGLDALRSRLGRAGMIRFLQQFSTGEGDYAQSRKEWVDQMSLADLRALADSAKAGNKRGKPKKKLSAKKS
jgi:hypothetical protein